MPVVQFPLMAHNCTKVPSHPLCASQSWDRYDAFELVLLRSLNGRRRVGRHVKLEGEADRSVDLGGRGVGVMLEALEEKVGLNGGQSSAQEYGNGP